MLDVRDLKVTFQTGGGTLTAVDRVSFSISEKKTLGLVGESGSGKSVTALSLLRLLSSNGQIESGDIVFQGKNIMQLSDHELRGVRGTEIGLIFQNPLACLNPVFSVGHQIQETICLHRHVSKEDAKREAIELLHKVNIPDPERRFAQYPHEFSIGMCQRVMIAITLAMRPKLLIADEPTASLDVTVQAQILNLLKELQREYDMSVLMISHDLGVIAQFCDEIMVMYLGKIVEKGSPQSIFGDPKHPYTQALISSIPIPDPRIQHTPTLLTGDIPSPLNCPSGCRFHPRCPKVFSRCRVEEPYMQLLGESQVSCWLYSN